jgi:hypothetical protein
MKIQIYRTLLALGLLLCFTACPQAEAPAGKTIYSSAKKIIYDDHIYDRDVQTVQFYRGEYTNSYPVIYMGDPTPLVLEFDEIMPQDQRESDFNVDFIHCDAEWNPSNILPIEFYEGFSIDRITDFTRSEFTKIPYVHYTWFFPGEDKFFKVSGNYILKVYRNNNNEDLVLTRRFVVVDRQVGISLKYLLNANLERMLLKTISFDLFPNRLKIVDPSFDLKVIVLQNGQWNTALRDLKPRFFGDQSYEYAIDLKKDFQTGNEFRRVDLSSMRFFGEGIRDIEETDNMYYVVMYADEPRETGKWGGQRDFNGGYLIQVQEWPAPWYMADYVSTRFRLHMEEPVPQGELYVTGGFSMWQMHNEFRMEYNDALNEYQADIILKQGIYDYSYVVRKTPSSPPDESPVEPRASETENFYTVLVYYKSPMDRSHQLVGYQPLNYVD